MSKGFSSAWLNEYENRSKTQSSVAQSVVRNEPMAAKEREISHSERLHVRVISYRKRLCDADNLCPKYFIDCLRYAEIIKDDSAKYITLEVGQQKSETDYTIIEIERIE